MHFDDSQAIFQQLAQTDGDGGVRGVIENHDAWTHAGAVDAAITAALRARIGQMPLDAVRAARVREQRQRLGALVVKLPSRHASAG